MNKRHTYIYFSQNGKRYSFIVDLTCDEVKFDYSDSTKDFTNREIIEYNIWLFNCLYEIYGMLTDSQIKNLMKKNSYL